MPSLFSDMSLRWTGGSILSVDRRGITDADQGSDAIPVPRDRDEASLQPICSSEGEFITVAPRSTISKRWTHN